MNVFFNSFLYIAFSGWYSNEFRQVFKIESIFDQIPISLWPLPDQGDLTCLISDHGFIFGVWSVVLDGFGFKFAGQTSQ